MTDDALSRFIHPEDAGRLPGGLRLRLAFLSLLQEVCPESDDAALALDNQLEYSGVYIAGPPGRWRWPGWPRAFQARERLGQQIAYLFPECRKAGAFFFNGGEVIGFLLIPLPGRE